MTLALRWRTPPRPLSPCWRGPLGMAQALARDPALPIAAIIGPPGPPGSGAPLRLDAPSSATWVLAHSLGRVPNVQVYLANGEAVLTDYSATESQITITFPTPQRGFVLIF